ncbi:MAG TPA: ATP-binding protein [Steroidobacteraceae bacterium]|jgi:two-component system sensor histidine kinase PilS (NtrC family)|nr:ATP-binding protein [Steroidobacteraceae bacterium]
MQNADAMGASPDPAAPMAPPSIMAPDAPVWGAPAQPPPGGDLAWRIVGLANLYRLLVPPALYALQLLTRPAPSVGGSDPRLFILVCAAYWVVGGLFAFGGRGRWPNRRTLVLSSALLDSAAISALLYCSGGVASGLGILLVIPVGAMALLAGGAAALGVAAIAALGLLTQQILVIALSNTTGPGGDYPLAGMLGAVLFVVALCAWPLSDRLNESEALVRRQEVDLANLAQLSQYIVQHLRESILVIDPSDRIRLINESAAQVLGDAVAVPGALIGEITPRLLYLLTTWRNDSAQIPHGDAGTFVAADGARMIRPHFAPLGGGAPAPVIVFLEDTGDIATRVQQTKLAALGRLSASIAHEIRNPVGAISHAAQLLAESPALGGEDRRLTQIMQANSTRVSGIIDNVLQLSRRESPRPETLSLARWTRRFRDEFCATVQLPPARLQIDPASEDIEVRIDGSQLHQIVWNLCHNGMVHALPRASSAPIELRHGRLGGIGRPYLQVADRGPGIDPADIERVFEPFFTRAQRGTGLGLFLARELAQANRATLLYEPREGGGSVFRIVFADPGRWTDLYS